MSSPHPGPEAPVVLDAPRLKVLAHPHRVRLLWELSAVASARTGDLASAIGQPVNKVSYHLKQLADAGAIVRTTAPAASTDGKVDGRETWWKLASTGGVTYDFTDPAVLASAADIQRMGSELRNLLELRSFELNRDRAWHMIDSGFNVPLTRAEADDYWRRLCDLTDDLLTRRAERLGTGFDHDVEYYLDLTFIPVAVRHPERGMPPASGRAESL